MHTETTFIKNRRQQELAVETWFHDDARGLVFLMHGLGTSRKEAPIQTMAHVFAEEQFNVVLFDTAHSFGESDGVFEDITPEKAYEDLQDVIAWARTRSFFHEPFWFAGHSLGGLCVIEYALDHPDHVAGIASVAPVISGDRVAHSPLYKTIINEWQHRGWHEFATMSRPILAKRLKWGFFENLLEQNVLPQAHTLSMPVLLMVGEKDDITTPSDVSVFYRALKTDKEFHLIKDAPHTMREFSYLVQIQDILRQWIHRHNS